MKRILASVVFFVLVSSVASAADWASRVSSMTKGNGQVDRLFDGPEGMTGIIIGPAPGAADNGKVLAWGMPDGLLVLGNVYDRAGRNLSEVVRQDKPEWFQSGSAAQTSVAPAAAEGDAVWQQAVGFLSSGRAVSTGQGRRIFIFTEAGCAYCKKFYREVQADPSLLRRFEIVWVPVTRDGKDFRTADILGGDLSILANQNKPVNISKEQEQIVYDNALFLQEKGGKLSTPAALVLDEKGSLFLYGFNAEYLKSMDSN